MGKAVGDIGAMPCRKKERYDNGQGRLLRQ
jgi:hypothetical protein